MKKALTLLLLGAMIFAPIGQITYAADNSAAASQTVQKIPVPKTFRHRLLLLVSFLRPAVLMVPLTKTV